MKLTTHGFTLIELMIVIAIIGVLATALFPSVTNYIERGRDAARMSHLKEITNAIGAYYADNEKYPTSTVGGCLDSAVLTSNYLPTFFTDPRSSSHQNGCGANGNYGYASGSGYSAGPQFIVSSIFESDFGGNYNNGSGAQSDITSIIGTGQFTFAERTALDGAGIVRKGNGSGYLIYK